MVVDPIVVSSATILNWNLHNFGCEILGGVCKA